MVGSDLDKDFEKFQHKLPVLSLINTYNDDELLDWVNKTDPDGLYSVEWKIDGASIVLYYENGMLKNGVTRGSGGIGDDVTDNIRTVRNIPLRLPEPITVYLRGEVFMTFKDFEEFNELSSGKYANPRNLSAGSIKQKILQIPQNVLFGFLRTTQPFRDSRKNSKHISKFFPNSKSLRFQFRLTRSL